MAGHGRKDLRDQLTTQRRAPEDKTGGSPETPRDVMDRVSNEAVKQLNELFKKDPKRK